jgi:ADP-heptose:LPS heptosyltransferase
MATVTAERGSRLMGRLGVVARASVAWTVSAGRRSRPVEPRRILIAHDLLLGDTLMLTPLVAKLRERHPYAELVMALPEAYAPLYASAPYGLRAIGWNSRRSAKSAIWREREFDLAFVPADNRYSWLAMALGARWIVAFSGDRPGYKSWPVDELLPYPATPAGWGDMVAGLLEGPPPAAYRTSDWRPPPAVAPAAPPTSYAVLHVGASQELKLWDPARWSELAARLAARGLVPVWSAGRREESIVRACDPAGRYRSTAGKLTLAQMWHLLTGASLLVSPDTGIAHLGRVVGTPTVALFGPGSAVLTGAGRFWRDAPYRAVIVDPFPCRDQRVLFKRDIAWVRRCARTLAECPHARCMDAIGVDKVLAAIDELDVVEALAAADAAHSARR